MLGVISTMVDLPDRPVLDRVVLNLSEVFVANLRKGVTQWNDVLPLIRPSCLPELDFIAGSGSLLLTSCGVRAFRVDDGFS